MFLIWELFFARDWKYFKFSSLSEKIIFGKCSQSLLSIIQPSSPSSSLSSTYPQTIFYHLIIWREHNKHEFPTMAFFAQLWHSSMHSLKLFIFFLHKYGVHCIKREREAYIMKRFGWGGGWWRWHNSFNRFYVMAWRLSHCLYAPRKLNLVCSELRGEKAL